MTSTSAASKQTKNSALPQSNAEKDGTIRVHAFELPPSSFVDATTHGLLQHWARRRGEILAKRPGHWADRKALLALRKFYDQHYYPELISKAESLYDVRAQAETIDGVNTEVFVPAELRSNAAEHVLINLHGGGFMMGARCAALESIPVAALAKTKVISIDYRMAPEYRFPAATEDVITVYRALLQRYESRNIGIFGCSAGALLAAQTVARLQKEGLPSPAAIAMLFGAASFWTEGDSGHFASALSGEAFQSLREHPYFECADPADPLVIPLSSPEILARFPPSLLVSATRDLALSSVVHMHSRLTALGTEAELRVWEGLHHAFFYDLNLPQSQEAHRATAEFFKRYLGGY